MKIFFDKYSLGRSLPSRSYPSVVAFFNRAACNYVVSARPTSEAIRHQTEFPPPPPSVRNHDAARPPLSKQLDAYARKYWETFKPRNASRDTATRFCTANERETLAGERIDASITDFDEIWRECNFQEKYLTRIFYRRRWRGENYTRTWGSGAYLVKLLKSVSFLTTN